MVACKGLQENRTKMVSWDTNYQILQNKDEKIRKSEALTSEAKNKRTITLIEYQNLISRTIVCKSTQSFT